MKLACIAIDVSKGSSHVRSFLKLGSEYGKIFKFEHNKEGFELLMDRYNELVDVSGHDAVFVFEATGVYHKCIEHYLTQHHKTFYMISPLQSAKQRKLDLRAAKTDKIDPINIAKVYYNQDLQKYNENGSIYDELRQLSRFYETQILSLTKAKVNYRESLDIIFPRLDDEFDVYDPCVMLLIQKYQHPERIIHKQERTLSHYLQAKVPHRSGYIQGMVLRIINYAESCMSGCAKEDIMVDILLKQLEAVQYFQERTQETLQRMKELAKKIDNYNLLLSIPGIGENLATRLLAEMGEIDRFDSPKQLIAYAGIDPIIYQSGKNEGKHYRISKKGNKNLRKLLYLAVTCCLRAKVKNNCIQVYFQKKKQQVTPMSTRAAYFACANKLLRVILGICKTKTTYI